MTRQQRRDIVGLHSRRKRSEQRVGESWSRLKEWSEVGV
jgi:hypothetical protein